VAQICFVVVPTIAAGSLPMVSAFIIRSGSFDAAHYYTIIEIMGMNGIPYLGVRFCKN
jgi:hypothetical protein